MAQRNPMNERYQGDGPQGKTRKSASKLKPKAEAASSVHIDSKPTTKSERKAAVKKRDAQAAAKEAERKRKAEERERNARIAAGEEVEEPKEPGVIGGTLDKVKKTLIGPPSASAKPAAKRGPDTPQYHRLKRIYWGLMAVGIVSIAVAFLTNFAMPMALEGWGMMVPMGVAYASVIAAIILDYTKIRKLQKAHMVGISGKGSPKQIKHEQRKAEAAALLEESKKAQKDIKRANSKIPFMRKSKSDEDSEDGSESATAKSSQDKSTSDEASPEATSHDTGSSKENEE